MMNAETLKKKTIAKAQSDIKAGIRVRWWKRWNPFAWREARRRAEYMSSLVESKYDEWNKT